MSKITEKKFYYYREKYIKYRNKFLKEKEDRNFDTYKIIHNDVFICGIDNGWCHTNNCTKDFYKHGCMYLKDIYKK